MRLRPQPGSVPLPRETESSVRERSSATRRETLGTVEIGARTQRPTEGSERNATAFLTSSCRSMRVCELARVCQFLSSSFTRDPSVLRPLHHAAPPALYSVLQDCCSQALQFKRSVSCQKLGQKGGSPLTAPQSLLTCTRFSPRAAVPLPALKRPNFSWGMRLYPVHPD